MAARSVQLQFKRLLSSQSIRLPHRQLIELKGPDGCGFLQGLVTADVLTPTRVAQYGMFLNTQGRVLYDVILYHMGNERVWLECDINATNDLLKHMKKYKLRSKVEINALSDIGVHALLRSEPGVKYNELIKAPDPRSSLLGDRLLISSSHMSSTSTTSDTDYHRHRIRHGVPEGTGELPPGQCLPFEVNLDLMKGVSFNKGCYIGQELTSRTYHTGVLRKRTLTLKMDRPTEAPIPWGTKITSSPDNGKVIGKSIAADHTHEYILGILRLTNLDIDSPVYVNTDDTTVSGAVCMKPEWWPGTTQ